MGTGKTNPSPAYGCAFIAEADGTQRPGTLEDYLKCLRLVQANEDYGIVDSVNATSIEKMIADFEVIRLVKAELTPFEVNEETWR